MAPTTGMMMAAMSRGSCDCAGACRLGGHRGAGPVPAAGADRPIPDRDHRLAADRPVPARDLHRLRRVPERGSARLVSRGRTAARRSRAVSARGASRGPRRSRRCLRGPETVFDGLEGRPHACRPRRGAGRDAAEISGPRLLARLYRHPELVHRAARGPRQPRLRRAQHRPPVRSDSRHAGRRACGDDVRQRRHVAAGRSARSSASGAPRTRRWPR